MKTAGDIIQDGDDVHIAKAGERGRVHNRPRAVQRGTVIRQPVQIVIPVFHVKSDILAIQDINVIDHP